MNIYSTIKGTVCMCARHNNSTRKWFARECCAARHSLPSHTHTQTNCMLSSPYTMRNTQMKILRRVCARDIILWHVGLHSAHIDTDDIRATNAWDYINKNTHARIGMHSATAEWCGRGNSNRNRRATRCHAIARTHTPTQTPYSRNGCRCYANATAAAASSYRPMSIHSVYMYLVGVGNICLPANVVEPAKYINNILCSW